MLTKKKRGPVVITTGHGQFAGRSLSAIVRREYGRRAIVRWSLDPNCSDWGQIVRYSRLARTYRVVAQLLTIDETQEA